MKKKSFNEPIEAIIKNLQAIQEGNYNIEHNLKKPKHSDKLSTAVYEAGKHFQDLSEIAFAASIGDYKKTIDISSNDDPLTLSINAIISKIRNVIILANKISLGNYSSEGFTTNNNDELDIALCKMNNALINLHKKNNKYIKKILDTNETLRKLSSIDPLTQVSNRLNFTDELNRSIALSKRKNRICAILLIDIDKFKLINDKFGHAAGDEILIQFAHLLSSAIRNSDRVVRMGGDEFAVILPEINHPDEACIVAESMINALNKNLVIDGHNQPIEMSIGIACFPDDGNNTIELLKNADIALYLAKKSNKSSFKLCRNSRTTK